MAMRATPGSRVALTAATLSEIAAGSTSSHFCGLCMSLLSGGRGRQLLSDPAYEPERCLFGGLAQWIVGNQAAQGGDTETVGDGEDLRRQVVGVDDGDIDSCAVAISDCGGDAA